MLITITNSNSSPEVNSNEVSLKVQCKFCVCTQKHSNHLLGSGAYMTFVLVHTCVYIQTRSSWEFAFKRRITIIIAMIIQITNFLSCVRSDHRRIAIIIVNNDDSSYEYSLMCNRSKTPWYINHHQQQQQEKLTILSELHYQWVKQVWKSIHSDFRLFSEMSANIFFSYKKDSWITEISIRTWQGLYKYN